MSEAEDTCERILPKQRTHGKSQSHNVIVQQSTQWDKKKIIISEVATYLTGQHQ